MKKAFLLSCIAILSLCTSVNAQTIHRCNNDPNVPLGLNMYRTLQAAHDAALANDIIYLEPSAFTYGTLTCSKTLRIIGNGYDHAQNLTISQPWEQKASIVGQITIEAGAGTVLQGLTFQSGGVDIKASNVTVTRCYFPPGQKIILRRPNSSQNASGAVISHNFGYPGQNNFSVAVVGYSTHNAPTCSFTAFQVQNVTIKNNINLSFFNMSEESSGGQCTPAISPSQIPSANNFTISNNIILGTPSAPFVHIYNCQNCTVHSNIFRNVNTSGILFNCPGTATSYNVCSGNPCVHGSNNVDAATDNLLFVGGSASTFQYDKLYQLTGFSPAVAAGLGGVDAGAFGTNNPYRLSGLAPVPQITGYSQNASSGIYTTATPMSITLSIRGNN